MAERTAREGVEVGPHDVGACPRARRLVAILGLRMRNRLARLRDVLGGRGRSFEALLADLGGDDADARRRAARALGRRGDPRAVEPLIAALDGQACGAAADALGGLGDRRAVEPLIAALEDHRLHLHHGSVATALGRLGDRRAVAPLVAALQGYRLDWHHDSAAKVLGDAGAVDLLVAELRAIRSMRRSVVAALDAFGWQPADDEQRCLWAIASGDWDRVATLGSVAVESLLAHLRAGEDEAEVATALARIGDQRAVAPLLDRLQHPPTLGKLEILAALATLDPGGAPARWVDALSSEDRTGGKVQEAAIGALREMRSSWDEGLVASLIALMESGRPSEARAAAAVAEGSTSPELAAALAAYRSRVGAVRTPVRGMPLNDLVAELVAIGRGVGYLGEGADFEEGRNSRARAIGRELDHRGGIELMRAVHARVTAAVGRIPARQLEAAWDGVGRWLG